jgi:biopolymer transport protein TolQ
MNPADLAQAAPVAHDMSLFGLFWQAHLIVKLVMIGLLAASVWCWAIIIDKTLLYSRTKRAMDRFEDVFWSGQSLEELFRSLQSRPATGLAAVFVAAMREWKRSFEGSGRSFQSLPQRIDKVLDVTIQREVERLDSRLMILASIGSAGPYIGLFGTVVGIMNSFTSIAASKSTSLAVVAPGIAEALFATAIGCSRPFRRCSPTTSSSPRSASCSRGSRASPTSSPPSCRARSTSASRTRPERSDPMAMTAGAAGAGRRRRRRTRRGGAINEINMTPFIDVMLVLLIVFMVAAPMMTAGVPLDLPQTKAAPLNSDAKPVTLSIKATGQIFLGETELTDEAIVGKLHEVAKQGFDERIFVRGDKKVDYGRVAQVMAIVTTAGYKRVALVTEADQR